MSHFAIVGPSGAGKDTLIAAALAFLAVVVTGLIMLIIGIWRYAAGRPYRVMLWGGIVLLAPLVVLFFSAL